jgi:uncharacterized membrane protein
MSAAASYAREAMLGPKVFGEGGEGDFRWRGGSVSRLEGLSDAVFALAMTLIVVSLDVPATYGELKELFVQAPVFAACFALLLATWFFHYRFHRRFGFEDTRTILLDALLLFLVLLYVYPLRFMASFLYNGLILRRDEGYAGMSWDQARALMVIYGLGFAAIYGVFALLYAHAWSKRLALELDSVERVLTKAEVHGHLISVAVALLSVAIALLGGRWLAVAGFAYFLMGPLHGLHGWLTGRAVARYRGKVPDGPLAT